MIYLREETRAGFETKLSIFEGNIKKDKEYWDKFHNTKTRYFELKEA